MDLSIVTTMYMSEDYIVEFYNRIVVAAEAIAKDFEIIFVDDGSPDRSLQVALSLYEKDSRVKVIDLSRNFGHHKAAMTGLVHAKGEMVFLIDVDLEEEPELLTQFNDIYAQTDTDVVFGVQTRRKGGLWERVSGAAFYWILNLLSTHEIPHNLLMARLMSRRYVDSLISFKESEFDISGLWSLTGFKQTPCSVVKRSKGATTYDMGKKWALMLRSITAVSNKPLVYLAFLGGLILVLATLYSLYVLGVAIFVGKPPSGYMSIFLSIWFLGGLTIFSLGVVAIYLSVMFVETKNRPYTIIRHIYDRSDNETG